MLPRKQVNAQPTTAALGDGQSIAATTDTATQRAINANPEKKHR